MYDPDHQDDKDDAASADGAAPTADEVTGLSGLGSRPRLHPSWRDPNPDPDAAAGPADPGGPARSRSKVGLDGG